MWCELERFVRAHSDSSPHHEKVLECLLDCKKPSPESPSPKKGKKDKGGDSESKSDSTPASPDPALAWKELDK